MPAQLSCGAAIQRFASTGDAGTAGCLVRFENSPEIFILTAGHILVNAASKPLDPVEAVDLPNQRFGLLSGWTRREVGTSTVDAALVRVAPGSISPQLGELGTPRGVNANPSEGDVLTIYAQGGRRSGEITAVLGDVALYVSDSLYGPVTYRNQIICEGFSEPGCSGAIAIDGNNAVVGMVVGGNDVPGKGDTFTAITPINSILTHPDWRVGALMILDQVPSDAATTLPAAPSVPVERPTLPQSSIDVLARTLWAEDRQDERRGMEAVAAVILNRLRAGQTWRWGSTIDQVCQKPLQFSCWNDGRLANRDMQNLTNADAAMWQVACDVAAKVVNGELTNDPTGGARHYVATRLLDSCADSGSRHWYCRAGDSDKVQIGNQTYIRNVA